MVRTSIDVYDLRRAKIRAIELGKTFKDYVNDLIMLDLDGELCMGDRDD